jgi:16S rRNA (cytosine967-C5)-methyltransferase
VKAGGRLVYATCTINRAENYDVVKDFLDANTRFKPVLPEAFCGIINDKRFDGTGVQLLPHKDGTAGFYISCLERANG